MEIIYIILTSALISGLFCFSFFYGFALGIKKQGNPEREVEINEENVGSYVKFLEWMNYTGGDN